MFNEHEEEGRRDICKTRERREEEGGVEGEGVERQCRTLRSFLNELRIELIFSWDGGGDRGWAGGKTNHGACLAYRTLPTSHPYVKSLSGSPRRRRPGRRKYLSSNHPEVKLNSCPPRRSGIIITRMKDKKIPDKYRVRHRGTLVRNIRENELFKDLHTFLKRDENFGFRNFDVSMMKGRRRGRRRKAWRMTRIFHGSFYSQ